MKPNIKGVTIEFINAPKTGARFKKGLFKKLVEMARLNKADRILIVFDRE